MAFEVVVMRAFFIIEEFVSLRMDASFEFGFTIFYLINAVSCIFNKLFCLLDDVFVLNLTCVD